MRLLPSEDVAEVGLAPVKLTNGNEAHDHHAHVLEGSKEEIEKQLRTSLEAFFDLYPEISRIGSRIARSEMRAPGTSAALRTTLCSEIHEATLLEIPGTDDSGGLWPQGWVARGACYSLGLAIVLFAVEVVLQMLSPKWGDSLAGWVKFLLFDAALLFSIAAFRSLRRKILWGLRNRLIVTYIFIAVIPAVLLVVMALITIYLFAGQFASFVVTSEINSQLRSMQAVNAAVSNELAARLEKGGTAERRVIGRTEKTRSSVGPAAHGGLARRSRDSFGERR